MPSLGSPIPPEVPNPRDAADNEIGWTREGLNLGKEYGRIDQQNPFGSQRWDGQKLITEYDPRITADYYGRMESQQGLRDKLAGGFNPTGLPDAVNSIDPSNYKSGYDRSGFTDIERGDVRGAFDRGGFQEIPGLNDFGAEAQRVQDAVYNRGATRLDRRFGQQRNALETSLRNKGFAGGGGEGGENGYDEAMGNFGQTENDAYQSLINDSLLAGSTEQSRLFGLGMQARKQQEAEGLTDVTLDNTAQKTRFDQTGFLRGLEGQEAQQDWLNDTTAQQLGFADRLAGGNFTNQQRQREFELQRNQWMTPFQASSYANAGQTQLPNFGNSTTALQNPVGNQYRQFTEDSRAQDQRRANFSGDLLAQAMDPKSTLGNLIQKVGPQLGQQLINYIKGLGSGDGEQTNQPLPDPQGSYGQNDRGLGENNPPSPGNAGTSPGDYDENGNWTGGGGGGGDQPPPEQGYFDENGYWVQE